MGDDKMKKYFLLVLMIVIFSAVCFAEDNITVNSFKVYVDGEQESVGWDDDFFRAEIGKKIEVVLRLENNMDNNIEVDVEGILYDISGDIERSETLDIDAKDKRTAVMEFPIPEDASAGSYDFEVSYRYSFDDNTYKEERIFEVKIEKETVDVNDILINLTGEIAEGREKTNEILNTMNNISKSFVSLGEFFLDSAKFDQNKTQEYIERYENISNELTACSTEKDNMYTQAQLDNKVSTAESDARREQKASDDNLIFIGIAGVVVYYFTKKKKENVGGRGEGEPITGTWK